MTSAHRAQLNAEQQVAAVNRNDGRDPCASTPPRSVSRWVTRFVWNIVGAIRHVMSGVGPQGCQVHGFGPPSTAELDHDFLWRCSSLDRCRKTFTMRVLLRSR